MGIVTVREYDDSFKEAVINLILGIQRKEFGVPVTREGQPDLSAIPDFYQTGNGNFWVALHDGAVAGTVSLKDIGNGQGALRKMFVGPAYRGAPYRTGQQLLDVLLEWARGRGVRDIYLGTTEKFLAAHRFYEKNGFAPFPKELLPENFPLMSVDTRFYRRCP
ncbi:Acetyltransferase, N-acetylglutamate synthase [uncultured delta proteobacterium]|uniref:Acetyltransferase, N-acetylglutamate synthase n=1 Tax=uncultured delta proteobacterium TaxID=34034 RepID=A0A212KD99_9DELT|nr:Acetyltransferase, N-acetylglutamate synthase [uncultured delta proteobacterium]